jgi:hypothetical protein
MKNNKKKGTKNINRDNLPGTTTDSASMLNNHKSKKEETENAQLYSRNI